ncbi:MAG: rRNA cytosine-C5-methyltransferase [Prevotellaceae bacterium]|jgi:16S rRNA C967 or C1407 C5-methylase (RsmB/RsmF family)/NOL1/NOP2/fmu family ribosome biogenesis protein|nr:rRNA cytosine-C5-methyltransferase [Prevotellaceae bacterium]
MFLSDIFINNIKSIIGDEYKDFIQSLEQDSPVSIRINDGIKIPASGLKLPFAGDVAWCKSGKYLSQRPVFTLDPLFHAGSYYVQEAASMFVEQCVNTAKKYCDINLLLDVCAAPGGKSTHLASMFQDGLLVSNEVIRHRSAILSENISKHGTPNVIVTSCDPSKFAQLSNCFDFILVDAPCSGEGMFRKDAAALREWSPEHVKHCASRQLRIVRDVWDSLKPGGFMLYSTCTYNIEENENIVNHIIENLCAETVDVDIPNGYESKIYTSLNKNVKAFRFFTHRTQSEGLFMSLIRKRGEMKSYIPKIFKHKESKRINLTSLIKNADSLTSVENEHNICIVPEKHAGNIEYIKRHINTISSGTRIFEIKGKELIPTLDFAHSKYINTDSFNVYNIDRATALSYFRKEVLPSYSGMEKGYILLMYDGVPLGWVKNIGSRSNNLLPLSRRIRMDIG